jgi:hypothetical protein
MKVSYLDLRYIDGRTWRLLADFEVDFEGEFGLNRVAVPKGLITDFNSIPRGFWNVAPPTAYGEAAVIHDYLYRIDSKPVVSRETADKAHRALMIWKGASSLRHTVYFRALRWFAWGAYHKKNVNG